MNSIAQQAVPKGSGQIEDLRPHLTTASSRVVIDVSRRAAERLDQAVGALEASTTRACWPPEALRPLLGDSARLVGSPVSPDTTEQYLLGSKYSADCVARIADDRQGFTLFTPLLLAHGGGNIYARDLHGRDTLLVHAFPNRPLFLLKPATAKIGEPPRFYPISRDSLERAWHDATR